MSAVKLFEDALGAEGVTGQLASLARSIYAQESGSGRNTTTSNRGARGGMQILPGTFAEVADKGWSIDNPEHNARAGIRYLKKLENLAGGDPTLTAVGYYGGPGGINQARRGVAVSDPKNPNAPTTLQYARQVVNRMGGVPDGTPTQSLAAAATPPAAAAGAPEAVSVEGMGVALPAELLNRPVAKYSGGPTAWQNFISAMPKGQGRAVAPADLDFGGDLPSVGVAQVSLPPPLIVSNKPVMESFKGWKAKLA